MSRLACIGQILLCVVGVACFATLRLLTRMRAHLHSQIVSNSYTSDPANSLPVIPELSPENRRSVYVMTTRFDSKRAKVGLPMFFALASIGHSFVLSCGRDLLCNLATFHMHLLAHAYKSRTFFVRSLLGTIAHSFVPSWAWLALQPCDFLHASHMHAPNRPLTRSYPHTRAKIYAYAHTGHAPERGGVQTPSHIHAHTHTHHSQIHSRGTRTLSLDDTGPVCV